MRIGCDVDGVLADFNERFIERVIAITGEDRFPKRPFDIPCWDYPQHYGYSHEQVSAVWESVTKDAGFWLSLSPLAGAMEVLGKLRALSLDHDLYFITSRPGVLAKQQTEVWLSTHSGDIFWTPTVLISGDKDTCVQALRLEAYIDDRDLNCDRVQFCSVMRTFILDQPWNRAYYHPNVERVASVDEMLGRLGLDETAGATFGQAAAWPPRRRSPS